MDGVIGKFVAYWMFVIGGLVVGRIFNLAGTGADVVVLWITLSIIYVGLMLIRANVKKKSAAKQAATAGQTPRHNNRHKKKK